MWVWVWTSRLIIGLLCWTSAVIASDGCLEVSIKPDDKKYVRVNEVFVTGGTFYPLNLILHNLSLEGESSPGHFAGKTVISLGEGFSGLVPHFLQHGALVRGLDLWYESANEIPDNKYGMLMKRYIQDYGDHLIAADARQTPLKSESVDLVVSHMLVNNLEDYRDKLEVIQEAIRVLKVGGEARIFGFNPDHRNRLGTLFLRRVGVRDRVEIAMEKNPQYKKFWHFLSYKAGFITADRDLWIIKKVR